MAGLRRGLEPVLRASFVLLPVLAAAELYWRWPGLPEQMASHFAADGSANGWQTRGAYAGFILGMIGFLWVVFGALQLWITRIPVELLNLPNKNYWLAPERRGASLDYVRRHLLLIGNLTLLLLVVINHGALAYNLGNAGALDGLLLWVGIEILATLGLMLFLWRRFRLPKEHPSP